MSDEIQRLLNAFYAQAVPAKQGARIGELVPISEGWESDMYALVGVAAEDGLGSISLREATPVGCRTLRCPSRHC